MTWYFILWGEFCFGVGLILGGELAFHNLKHIWRGDEWRKEDKQIRESLEREDKFFRERQNKVPAPYSDGGEDE